MLYETEIEMDAEEERLRIMFLWSGTGLCQWSVDCRQYQEIGQDLFFKRRKKTLQT